MDRQEIFELVRKYNRGQCTPEEEALLETWYVNKTELYHTELSEPEIESALQEVYTFLPKPAKKMRLWTRIAVAAAAVAAIVFGVWFYTNEIASSLKTHRNDVAYKNDIAPGKNTAILTLANGKSFSLSEAKAGVVVGEDKLTYNDHTPVVNKRYLFNGQDEGKNTELKLSTPRGGTYQITLSDGTKVWLNAATSLTYTMVRNSKGERRVKLEGEAYFEVARDKRHPFIVSSNKQEVKVLGTHFNISSYTDDPNAKTTLLEGSVDVNGQILEPNQLAVNHNGKINVWPADIESAMAWKRDEFSFNDEELGSIMKKIARWYDVEVYYEDPQMASAKFWGTISRFKNISDVLRMLEKTNKVQFKLEGRRIMVTK